MNCIANGLRSVLATPPKISQEMFVHKFVDPPKLFSIFFWTPQNIWNFFLNPPYNFWRNNFLTLQNVCPLHLLTLQKMLFPKKIPAGNQFLNQARFKKKFVYSYRLI